MYNTNGVVCVIIPRYTGYTILLWLHTRVVANHKASTNQSPASSTVMRTVFMDSFMFTLPGLTLGMMCNHRVI